MSFEHTSAYATAAINTDVYVNVAANNSKKSIKKIICSLSATPANTVFLSVESPVATVLGKWYITTAGEHEFDFTDKGLSCGDAAALQVLLDLTADANTIGTLFVLYNTE